jgi:uncharacterized membrane protein
MESLVNFFGRLHPLVVHLPIGILLLAFLFDFLSQFKKYKKLSVAVQPSIFLGSISAIVSALSGYSISQEGGYPENILWWHQYAGITTAALSVVLFLVRRNRWVLTLEKNKRKPIRFFLFIPVVALLGVTGHLGGSLTHGEDFLTAPYSSEKKANPISKIEKIANVPEANLYADVIDPILDSKCYSCHSSRKQKGDLRLDGMNMILKGGKHGRIVVERNADSSTIYKRVTLPLEDEHHMPPEKKEQLTSVEIDLIHFWIAEGASFEKKVGSSVKAERLIKTLVESTHQENWMPQEEVAAADEDVVLKLKASGVLVLPFAVNNNYISASFINKRSPDKDILNQLLPLRDQLISLSLSYCKVSSMDLDILKQFPNLIWLYLDHTNANDSIAPIITQLPKLKYLNLVGTSISDESLSSIGGIKTLKELYVYQSKITLAGIKKILTKNSSVKLDTGNYQLAKLTSDTLRYRKIK